MTTTKNNGCCSRPGVWQLLCLGVILVLGFFVFRAGTETARFQREASSCRAEFKQKLAEEHKKIAADLEQKYSADRVSYQAMARRVEQLQQQLLAAQAQRGQ
jgi:uncharacterized protein HemX